LLLGVLGFEEEELGDYYCADAIVHGAVEADYALFEEAGEYIVWINRVSARKWRKEGRRGGGEGEVQECHPPPTDS